MGNCYVILNIDLIVFLDYAARDSICVETYQSVPTCLLTNDATNMCIQFKVPQFYITLSFEKSIDIMVYILNVLTARSDGSNVVNAVNVVSVANVYVPLFYPDVLL